MIGLFSAFYPFMTNQQFERVIPTIARGESFIKEFCKFIDNKNIKLGSNYDWLKSKLLLKELREN